MRLARSNLALRAESNHGRPPIAATARVSEFSGRDVIKESRAGETYHPADANAQRARDLQARQDKERQDLRDRQAAERAEMDRQHASEERRQTLVAAHAHQQEELARRHKQDAEDVERRRHDPA
jgi:hypothetical protein